MEKGINISKLKEDMIVVVDTREKVNAHVTAYFDEIGQCYSQAKLDSGDYSVYFPNYPEFNYCVIVERKKDLSEIATNFTSKREQFKREFERVDKESIMALVIEDATWTKVFNGSYRSNMSPQSMTASLLTWINRYSVQPYFVSKGNCGQLIYNIFIYGLMQKIIEKSVDINEEV